MTMLIYTGSLATPGNLTTNGTTNTETDAFFIKPGSGRSVSLLSCQLGGKGGGLTTISGIAARFFTLTTASTAGTGITPNPVDKVVQAAKATSASRPTIGSTRQNHHVQTFGAAGPGGFVSENNDAMIILESANAGSIDMADVSTTISLTYEFSYKIAEQ